jgi:hypothetical protein
MREEYGGKQSEAKSDRGTSECRQVQIVHLIPGVDPSLPRRASEIRPQVPTSDHHAQAHHSADTRQCRSVVKWHDRRRMDRLVDCQNRLIGEWHVSRPHVRMAGQHKRTPRRRRIANAAHGIRALRPGCTERTATPGFTNALCRSGQPGLSSIHLLRGPWFRDFSLTEIPTQGAGCVTHKSGSVRGPGEQSPRPTRQGPSRDERKPDDPDASFLLVPRLPPGNALSPRLCLPTQAPDDPHSLSLR